MSLINCFTVCIVCIALISCAVCGAEEKKDEHGLSGIANALKQSTYFQDNNRFWLNEGKLQCYATQNLYTVVSVTCPVDCNSCATIIVSYKKYFFKGKKTGYACIPQSFCNKPKAVCQEVQKIVPEVKVLSCKVTCCSTNNCNKPSMTLDTLVRNEKISYDDVL